MTENHPKQPPERRRSWPLFRQKSDMATIRPSAPQLVGGYEIPSLGLRSHFPNCLTMTYHCCRMTKDIVGKLMRHLSKPVDDEPGVVYLLAEVRKLLERDDPTHSNGALWMYCHWALHVDLTKPGATMDFLKRVDRWITNTVAYLTPSGPWEFIEEHRLFRDFIFLATFRQQLRGFLASYGLPTSLCDLDEQWYAFLEAYSGVIEDGTLSTKSDKRTELGAVKQVVFTKGEDLTADHHLPFVIQWNIELKDGRTVRTNVETVPTSGGNMTAHLLEVRHPPRSGWLDELGRLKGGRAMGLDAARCAS